MSNRVKWNTVVCALALSAGACSQTMSRTESSANCPRFAVGDSWTYRSSVTASGLTITDGFTITVIRNDGATVETDLVYSSDHDTIHSTLKMAGGGAVLPVSDRVGSVTTTYVSSTPLCPPAAVGAQTVFESRQGSELLETETVTVTALGTEEVTVPAGRFTATKIVSHAVVDSVAGEDWDYTWTDYFASDVGFVKSVGNFADGSVQVQELLAHLRN